MPDDSRKTGVELMEARSPAASVLPPPPTGRALQLRSAAALLLALLLGVLAVHWVVQNELVHASIQVGNSVPPIPALTAVLLLGGAAALFRRLRAGRPPSDGAATRTRTTILAIYVFLTLACAIPATASMSFFFAFLTVPAYKFPQVARWLPSWFAPTDPAAIERMYRGTPGEPVPWAVWALPLLGWGSFLFLLILTLYAALALLRRSWMEAERLTYPMVQIPLGLIGADASRRGTLPLWRDPAMWLGLGLEAAFDGVNMLHTVWPSLPSLGTQLDAGAFFPDRPWSALAPFVISYRPEIFGIGFLMPTDVLLTAWLSYLLLRLSTVVRVATGAVVPSTAYDYQELGIGAFLTLFALLLWRAQPDLRRSFRAAFGGNRPPRGQATDEPLSPRAAWLVLGLGTAGMLLWLWAAGLALWLGALHLGIVMAVAVVYARMRAETGAPMIFLFPFWQQQLVITNVLGTEWLTSPNPRSYAVFSALGGLSRGFYPQISAYSAEGMCLAARARFPQRWVTLAVVGGLALGLVLGGYLYLVNYYHTGAMLLDGGAGRGGYRIYLARQNYEQALRVLTSPVDPKPDLIFQTGLGSGIAVLFALLRQRLLWFPLHPMGFAMASAYGYHLWGPFLAVWLLKVLVLRFGGHTTYRRLVPFFLGIALGRYLFAGIVWGILGLLGSPVTESYPLHFG
jgi:hypothetical protein